MGDRKPYKKPRINEGYGLTNPYGCDRPYQEGYFWAEWVAELARERRPWCDYCGIEFDADD